MRKLLTIVMLLAAAVLGTGLGIKSTPVHAQSHSCCENICLGARDPQYCYNQCIHDRCGPCAPGTGCLKGKVKVPDYAKK